MDAGGSEGKGKGQGVCAGGNVEGRGRDEGRGIGSGGCSEVRRAAGVGGGAEVKGVDGGADAVQPTIMGFIASMGCCVGVHGAP